jgi:hypothetical protein
MPIRIRARETPLVVRPLYAVAVAATLLLTACASSSQLIGSARPPTSPDQVRLYLEPPAGEYDRIAILDASSKRSFSFSTQAKADVVISRLKQQAAKLGANGIVLQGISDESSGSFATSVGTGYEGGRGTVDLGFGVSALMLQRYGRAVAIYLAPSRQTDLGP